MEINPTNAGRKGEKLTKVRGAQGGKGKEKT